MPARSADSASDKPQYRVPLMAEVAAVPLNGYTAASTFSGGGGSTLGYRLAGFKVAYASEFIPDAADTYRANNPDTFLDGRDIRAVSGQDILAEIGLGVGELDLLDGSPPCAAFSMSGKRERHWGRVKDYSDAAQRVDDLFFEYSRLVREIQPKTFVAENVSGLVKGVARGYFMDIFESLESCGYRVEAQLLDAARLGVPQSRQRLIFVGVRRDLGPAPAFPKPLPYQYTFAEAVADLPPTVITRELEYRGKLWLIAKQLKPGQHGDDVTGRGFFNLGRLRWDRPCWTVMAMGGASASSHVHPDETRRLSVAELKRVCSFPDDYVLTGNYTKQHERLGRAVPPVMMYWIAKTVQAEILDKL
jgi:DNA (cytosine-5)-methyltransferase 1